MPGPESFASSPQESAALAATPLGGELAAAPRGADPAALQRRVTELEQQLADTQSSALRDRDALLRRLSHDLRNPLSPITTSLAILKTTAAPESRRMVEVIERQVRELTRIIETLTAPTSAPQVPPSA